jgi:hypothetical protein
MFEVKVNRSRLAPKPSETLPFNVVKKIHAREEVVM